MTTLALFDLDHTLLDGDGDDLWCRFLLRHGLVGADLQARNEQMGADYRAGRVSVEAFSDFYAGLLAGRTPVFWSPWQDRFLVEEIRHRLPDAARALVASHREAGHRLVLTTASNSVIAARTAADLGFNCWLATELAMVDGVYTGRVKGVPNMREGKLRRLRVWMAEQGLPADALERAWFYSDSINDLPLLGSVGNPVAVNPDAQLHAHATAHDWRVIDVLGKAML
ncbi:HAD family hydrolase [Hydrogenophaga laconesensis]|uniref:HAD superfamily hydrolase (TIGR01490 family) n=1 Tax=Hydrogenophaga laconesensis TaxID=1805971 RepID=A0ABU1VD29_9BURK|nr:HAD family hydrolase [Hydrogenophaga laconesensis]MDR7095374.1 HAD superfamily hydrolase (TIGR01490 family) [Hydrogenophaga laconesensis]